MDQPAPSAADQATTVRLITEAGSGAPAPLPLIGAPPDTVVDLPGGGIYSGGVWHGRAVLRELTGDAEEALSRAEVSGATSRYMRAALQFGIESLGEIEPLTNDHLGMLLLGDRNMLLMRIRAVTYGPEIHYRDAVCPRCQTKLDITIDLNTDVPIRQMDDSHRRQFTVQLSNGRGKAEVTLPTASDQDAVLDLTGKTTAERNTLILARTLVTVNDMPVSGEVGARGLSMAIRRDVLEFLVDNQPGPQFQEVGETCPTCAERLPLPIDVGDLFRL